MSVLKRLRNHPTVTRWMVNLYLPYLGAGVRARELDFDAGRAVVEMPLTRFNRNYVGTQFGGSLYSMVDPFYMIMLMHQLGSSYVVWDKSSHIEFIAPGNSKVTARLKIPSNEITTIQELAKDGEPVFREYQADIVDDQQKIIATVTKTLYIRLRKYSKSKDQTSRIENLDG